MPPNQGPVGSRDGVALFSSKKQCNPICRSTRHARAQGPYARGISREFPDVGVNRSRRFRLLPSLPAVIRVIRVIRGRLFPSNA